MIYQMLPEFSYILECYLKKTLFLGSIHRLVHYLKHFNGILDRSSTGLLEHREWNRNRTALGSFIIFFTFYNYVSLLNCIIILGFGFFLNNNSEEIGGFMWYYYCCNLHNWYYFLQFWSSFPRWVLAPKKTCRK